MQFVFFVESYGYGADINGVCVRNVAEELTARGHQVSVFTCITSDNQISEETLNGVSVYRMRRDLTSALRARSADSRMYDILYRHYSRFNALLYSVILGRWPQRSVRVPGRYVALARQKLKAEPDFIVGTYFLIDEVLAALKLEKYYPNAKTAIYLLDSMGGRDNPVLLNRFDTQKSVLRWEQMAFSQADFILPMEAHRDYIESAGYDEKICSKIHYVDIPLMMLHGGEPEKTDIQRNPDRIQVVYTGYTSRRSGSAESLIQLMEEIPELEFHLYGAMSREVQKMLERSPLKDQRLFFHGRVDNSVAVEAQRKADFLVTFGSNSQCMISGKIFEYMARRKPIISFYQLEDDPNRRYLEKYPDVLFLREGEESFARNAELLREFISGRERPQIHTKELKKIFEENMPGYTADLLVSLGDK